MLSRSSERLTRRLSNLFEKNRMTVQEMTEQIVSVVTELDTASFVELLEACGPEAIGDLTLTPRRNLLLWRGVSGAFCEALTAAGTRVLPVPTEPLVYLVDGGFLCLPVAKQLRHYSSPHWLPVVFRTRAKVEQEAARKKRAKRLAALIKDTDKVECELNRLLQYFSSKEQREAWAAVCYAGGRNLSGSQEADVRSLLDAALKAKLYRAAAWIATNAQMNDVDIKRRP